MAISWLQPLHMQPWVSWHSEAIVFFGVFAAVGLVLLRSLNTPNAVLLPRPAWLALALLLLTLGQWLTGRISYAGDVWVVLFYAALALACLGLGYAAGGAHTGAEAPSTSIVNTPAALLAWVMLLIGIASTAVGLVQTFDVWAQSEWLLRPTQNWRPGGQVGQANHFAIGLLLALISSIYLLAAKKLGIVTTLMVVTYLGLGVAIGHSRTSFFCIAVLGAWWTYKQPCISAPYSRWWGLATALMLMGMFLLWPMVFDEFYMASKADSSRLTISSLRFVVWPQLIETVWARPWLGWGVLQVAPAHNSVLHNYPVSEAFGFSHNILLDAAVWFGIPTALVFFITTCTWLWRRASAVDSLQSWYLFGLLLPLGIGSLMEFPYVYAYCLAPVLFAVGMLERELRCKPMLRLPVRVAVVPYMLVSALMAWSAVEYIRVEEDTRVARFEALRVGKTPEGYSPPNIVLLTQLSSLAASTRIVPVPGMDTAQMDLLKNAALRYPWTATGFRYASALALNGNQAEAWRQMQVMRATQGEKMHLQLMDVLMEKLAEHKLTWQPAVPQR